MALGGKLGRNAPYGAGRYMGGAAGGAKRSPQSFVTALLHDDVIGYTDTSRAAQLSIIPKRTRTYFAPYKPGSAQRIPPMADRANPNNVRATLVARSKILLTTLQKQGASS